ncbi:MAG: hypothetical protein HYY44_07960 [Deltaproteobacteria bacterium]|nr:hypothetical protein [Deltaproteobacteria bacterium]
MTSRKLTWIPLLILEFPFLSALVGGETCLRNHPCLSLGLHLFASLLFFALVSKNLGVLFALFPGLGVIGLGLLKIFGPPGDRKGPSGTPDEWEEGPLPVEPQLAVTTPLKSKTGRILEELDLMSLSEILLTDDFRLKRGAIEKLGFLKTPAAIQMLLGHRGDPSPEVRFYVTSALERVKREFDEEVKAAKSHIAKNPGNPSVQLSVAKIYRQSIDSGLLDEATGNAYQREVLYHVTEAVASGEAPGEAYLMLCRLHEKRGNREGALKTLEQLEKSGRSTLNQILKERAQIFYEAGRYDETTRQLRQLKEQGERDTGWIALSDWWTGGRTEERP